MRWAWNVARTGECRCAYKVSYGIPRESDHLENRRLDGRITLKWIFPKTVEGCKLSWFKSGKGQVAGWLLWTR